MVKKAEHYAWTSHNGYVSSAKKWDWLYKDFILSMFASPGTKGRQAYQEYIGENDSEKIIELFGKSKWPSLLGSEKFIDWARANFFDHKSHHQIPDSVLLAPDLEEILECVSTYYGVPKKKLQQARRGASNEPRNVAIYLCRILRRDNLLFISEVFSMAGYSPASSAIERGRKRLAKGRQLEVRIEDIRKRITTNKSQTETCPPPGLPNRDDHAV